MKYLIGYEEFSVRYLNTSFIENTYDNGCIESSWAQHRQYDYGRLEDNNDVLIFCDENSKVNASNCPPLREKLYHPVKGDALFYNKFCKIPRIKTQELWPRTTRLVKAKAVVVPEVIDFDVEKECAIFFFGNTLLVYEVSKKNLSSINENTTLEDVCRFNGSPIANLSVGERAKYEAWKHCKCIYRGGIMYYNERSQWFLDTLDGIYPRVVFETSLLDDLGDETQSLTPDNIQSLMDLLNSSDTEASKQGLRVLSNMDYRHYPSVTKYILIETCSSWRRIKNLPTSVTFMFAALGYKPNTYGYSPFKDVKKEEFDVSKDLLKEVLKIELQDWLQRWQGNTNVKIDCDFNISLSFPETEPTQSDIDVDAVIAESQDVIDNL